MLSGTRTLAAMTGTVPRSSCGIHPGATGYRRRRLRRRIVCRIRPAEYL